MHVRTRCIYFIKVQWKRAIFGYTACYLSSIILLFSLFFIALIFFCFIWDLTEVDAQYTGARIEGDTVTLDFVKHMMGEFKKQKCIHKRYIGNLLLV